MLAAKSRNMIRKTQPGVEITLPISMITPMIPKTNKTWSPMIM